LEGIVTNGLRSTVNDIKDKLESFCAYYAKQEGAQDARLVKLESFSWFREWVNGLRNNLFKYFILLAVSGGVIYILITHGHEIIDRIFK
jgi:hypothetical protein